MVVILTIFMENEFSQEKIEKLILNRNLGREMGNKSKELAKQLSWEFVANKYFDIYSKTKKY